MNPRIHLKQSLDEIRRACWLISDQKNLNIHLVRRNGKQTMADHAADKLAKNAAEKAKTLLREEI